MDNMREPHQDLVRRESIKFSEKLLVRARRIGLNIEERVEHLLGREQPMTTQAMTAAENSGDLSTPRRQEIFAALVEAQDHGTPVAPSRQIISERFNITPEQVKDIER